MHKYSAQETTIGQLLIEQALPESMRGQRRILDNKGVEALFQELAEKHPDQYSDVAKKISDIGRHAATATGGFSGGLRHLQQPAAARRMRLEMQQKLQDIYAQDIPDEEKNKRVLEFAAEAQKRLAGEVYAEALAAKNVMALQADTGVRGNKMNVNSLLGADMLYADNDNKPVPVPVTRSYSMGLTPAQYFAGAFGARKGISDVQSATQDGGYFAKQLNQISHRLVVSGRDADDYDPTTVRGLPIDTDDKFNAGSLSGSSCRRVSTQPGAYPEILKELKAAGHDTILIRSPMVGGPADGGVYSYDAGVRERGGLSPVGDFLGLAAAQAISEGVTQSGLSSKHCLAKGTLVRMADFSVKAIEDIQIGDMVCGADMFGFTHSPAKVVRTYDNGPRECFAFAYYDNFRKSFASLEATKDHKILVAIFDESSPVLSKLVPAGEAATNVMLNGGAADLVGTYPLGNRPTYDIEIDNADHIFWLANGMVVSNSGGVVGAQAGQLTGFKLFDSLVQVPAVFPGGATHAGKMAG